MPLKTLVKVGSLTNLSDARYCAGMGVEMIGFQVIPGMPSYISSEKYQEIRGWISGPGIVAEISGLKDRSMIATVMDEYKPDYIELGIDDLSIAGEMPVPYIINLQDGQLLPEFVKTPAYVLSANAINVPQGVQLLIDVKSSGEAADAIKGSNVAGIATSGSSEIRPGYKNYDELAAILEVLEED